jgi:hypothetical protein
MLQNESILILGASANPNRTSFMATRFLSNKGFELQAVAAKKGMIDDLEITTQLQSSKPVDTITIFLNAQRQKEYYDMILSLKPKRIIFNPGTENPELEMLAKNHCIQTLTGCTIAMITAGLF